VLKHYVVPAGAEYSLIEVFAATFTSTTLTFFIGALLYDYQADRNEANRGEQLRRLLMAELNEIVEGLNLAHATRLRLSDGWATEAVISHLQPTVTEEAVRGGFLDLLQAEGVLRLAWNTRAYNAKVSYLLSTLSLVTTAGPATDEFVLHAIEEIEATRR
jgi:hypothetical protein